MGIPEPWSNSLEKENISWGAKFHSVIFTALSILLVTSIIQTIRTNPGNIPDDKEWDMLTDSMAESSNSDDNGEVGFSSDDGRSNKSNSNGVPQVAASAVE